MHVYVFPAIPVHNIDAFLVPLFILQYQLNEGRKAKKFLPEENK